MSDLPDDMGWPYEHEVRVIWRDLDAAGHVNNAVYFTYFESARAEVFLRLRGGKRWQDLDIILARTSCDYRSAATMGEVLVVKVTPTKVGSTSFGFRYEVRARTDGRLVAEGDSVQVMYDYAAGRPKAIPPELRARLESGITAG